MTARLVAITQPVFPELEGLDIQGVISYCARVSNPSNQLNPDNHKLLSYLIRHKHWSPFEMISATVEITTTRDIARQILRHRSFSFQEFSQRYAEPTDMDFLLREARLQDSSNRQNSFETDDADLQEWWEKEQVTQASIAAAGYSEALARGIAKEVARAILPEGLTQSRLYMAGTLRSWIHYLELRTGPETQKEHRAVARECLSALLPHCPFLGDLLN